MWKFAAFLAALFFIISIYLKASKTQNHESNTQESPGMHERPASGQDPLITPKKTHALNASAITGAIAGITAFIAILSFFKIDFYTVKSWLEDSDNPPTVTDSPSPSPTASPSPTSSLGDIGEVGDTVTFGTYSVHSEISADEAPPIEWYIIQKDGDNAKLLSKYGLAYKPFEDVSLVATIWQDSSICSYLNGEFYTDYLRSAPFILETTLFTNSPDFDPAKRTSKHHVYLLSQEEFVNLLSDHEEIRVCVPSDDAQTLFGGKKLFEKGDGWYLRDEGKNYSFVASVNVDGTLSQGGVTNNGNGVLIRPCITISISEYLAYLESDETN